MRAVRPFRAIVCFPLDTNPGRAMKFNEAPGGSAGRHARPHAARQRPRHARNV